MRKSLRVKSTRQPRRRDIKSGAGAFVFGFAVAEPSAAMAAGPRGHPGGGDLASLLIARKIDDVAASRYDFLNHCILAAWINVMADKFRYNVQRTAQILREKLWRAIFSVPRTQRSV